MSIFAIFGRDFWRAFELAPEVVNLSVPVNQVEDVSLAELTMD